MYNTHNYTHTPILPHIYATQSPSTLSLCPSPTSEVLDEVVDLHLPLGLDVGAVHVRVEEDDGEGQDEDGVRVPELPHHARVADAVALAAEHTREHTQVGSDAYNN